MAGERERTPSLEAKGVTTVSAAEGGVEHTWVAKTFSAFTWCNACLGFIYGLRLQGYECVDCQFA
eukprot:CAMPEP_0198338722 /NCGR_PEP_ID=MMETSP1450-20131203/36496_1 /TAXON_ID=753684 ORGANISM="Madagascaria erythrocladiodes, Strain CCMP3234" /NCGR_SAMPLE_ID=MMETSP1450 /ASSEMBLY_ACC=CAM_ASM_001115 /LENGTH=64 /DNA_ID=CAMNT_0044043617 /DNA_START=55 /DNA_END=246 /DNA_ORIENTATION=+